MDSFDYILGWLKLPTVHEVWASISLPQYDSEYLEMGEKISFPIFVMTQV